MTEFFPGLHPDPGTVTTGLEGYTTDGRALLGFLPGTSSVVACGFPGSGFKFAPVMGEIAADLACAGAPLMTSTSCRRAAELRHGPRGVGDADLKPGC